MDHFAETFRFYFIVKTFPNVFLIRCLYTFNNNVVTPRETWKLLDIEIDVRRMWLVNESTKMFTTFPKQQFFPASEFLCDKKVNAFVGTCVKWDISGKMWQRVRSARFHDLSLRLASPQSPLFPLSFIVRLPHRRFSSKFHVRTRTPNIGYVAPASSEYFRRSGNIFIAVDFTLERGSNTSSPEFRVSREITFASRDHNQLGHSAGWCVRVTCLTYRWLPSVRGFATIFV